MIYPGKCRLKDLVGKFLHTADTGQDTHIPLTQGKNRKEDDVKYC